MPDPRASSHLCVCRVCVTEDRRVCRRADHVRAGRPHRQEQGSCRGVVGFVWRCRRCAALLIAAVCVTAHVATSGSSAGEGRVAFPSSAAAASGGMQLAGSFANAAVALLCV